MPLFNVGVVSDDLREIWSEVWDQPEPHLTTRASRKWRRDHVVEVQAVNAADAIAKAERARPGHVAIRDSVRRIDRSPRTLN